MMENNYELYHYGVKGMKWGVRKKRPETEVDRARAAKKTAHKEYNAAYNKAYKYSSRHPISQFVGKKAKAESDRLWEDAYTKADASIAAKKAYKQAKKDDKQAKKLSISRKDAENKAADALDRVSKYMFFNGDKIPNNFAIQRGLDTLSDGLRNGDGVWNSTMDAIDKYTFFAD